VKSPLRLAVAALAVALAAGCSSESKSAPTTATAATTAVPVTTEAPATTEGVDTTAAAVTADTPATTEAPPTTEAPATTEAGESTPLRTTTVIESFVDSSRPTAATASSAELPSRTIETTIVYPEADGPFPLIVLNHGLTGLPSKLTRLSSAWAAAGYVVVMPAFPLTNGSVPGARANSNDVVNQPADVSFVIDSVLSLAADETSPLYGRVDGDHIGVAGHSLGGATTYGLALNRCCRDERVDAIVTMASFIYASPDNDYSRSLPVMIVHGDADPVLNISLDQAAYDLLAGPKWFITLLGGSHSTGIEDLGTPYDAIVDEATSGFWNLYLSDARAEPAGVAALRAGAAVEGLSALQTSE